MAQRGGMRWERLFADLDDRFEELADEQMLAELAERTRAAAGAIRLTARLAGARGRPLRVSTTAGAVLGGTLAGVGPDWVLLREAPGREVVIALSQVSTVQGLTAGTGTAPTGVGLRLDLRHVLRTVARDRAPVAVLLLGSSGSGASGSDITGSEITGTLDRVGADFVELAVHAPWEPRRATDVRTVLMLPLANVVAVRSVPMG